jgi:hypothetical protein
MGLRALIWECGNCGFVETVEPGDFSWICPECAAANIVFVVDVRKQDVGIVIGYAEKRGDPVTSESATTMHRLEEP